ncbi:aminotransferase class V-fold PLP-dependent enzyme [Streptomyces sp. NPDC021212]|uniref:aminotransferase class V-fold PLP-dependent enzyme n=1 Tax=Streptomyces sp. NPDC021212 TaxID=3365118 RepID=UPI003788C056
MRNYRVTGPVEVPAATLAAMNGRMISHRSTGFRDLFGGLGPRLGTLFGTTGPVLTLTCSGTGGLEAAAASVLRPGDRVLSVQLGYFGERFAEIAAHHGAVVDVLAAPWGEIVPTGQIIDRLAVGYDAVLLTHNETSTGVVAPLAEWARAIRSVSDCLILVDTVSGLAATEIGFDALGLDVAVSVTQKALACPPGLALVAVSERALDRAAEPGEGSYYLSLARAAEHAREATTAYTPALSVLYALDAALTAIEKEGVEAVWERHARTARRCREALRDQGLTIVPDEAHSSPTVTAVRVPGGSAKHIRRTLAAEHDVWVSSGRGPWKSEVLRIGHMGPVAAADIDACARAIGLATAAPPSAARRAGATPAAPASGAAPVVRAVGTAEDLAPDWDGLVARLDAPLFHTRAFLTAYEHHPVQRISEPRYLEVRRGGQLVAAAPTYLQGDPLGLLGLADGEQALLSPMWHSPDSRLLADDDEALATLSAAFAARAAELGAPVWGFVNLSADNPMLRTLERNGFRRQDLVPRWTLHRSDAPDEATYLAGMRRSVRRDYERQLRRYRERGQVRVHGAGYQGLVPLLELIAASAARTGSPKYYDPLRLAAFLRELDEPVRVVEIRENSGEPLAVAVCFLEEKRLQAWAGGYVRGRTDLKFSPYYALWWEIVELMRSSGAESIECGRLNETFKEKMLLSSHRLVAMIGPTHRPRNSTTLEEERI